MGDLPTNLLGSRRLFTARDSEGRHGLDRKQLDHRRKHTYPYLLIPYPSNDKAAVNKARDMV